MGERVVAILQRARRCGRTAASRSRWPRVAPLTTPRRFFTWISSISTRSRWVWIAAYTSIRSSLLTSPATPDTRGESPPRRHRLPMGEGVPRRHRLLQPGRSVLFPGRRRVWPWGCALSPQVVAAWWSPSACSRGAIVEDDFRGCGGWSGTSSAPASHDDLRFSEESMGETGWVESRVVSSSVGAYGLSPIASSEAPRGSGATPARRRGRPAAAARNAVGGASEGRVRAGRQQSRADTRIRSGRHDSRPRRARRRRARRPGRSRS